MKGSRKFVIGGLLLAALFCGGAILGSYLPAITTYLSITVAAIAASILILYGYTGQTVKKRSQPKKKERPASTEATDGGFTDVYSGR